MIKNKEIWTKYLIQEIFNCKYYIDSISDNINGFEVVMSSSKNETDRIKVCFDGPILSYRSTDESFRQKLIFELTEIYSSDFYKDTTIFKVENSRYITWLKEESYEWSETLNPRHFCFLSVDSILDVVACDEPKISKL